MGLKLQSAARANRLRGFGLSAMGFAAWLAIGSQAEAFPYWGSSEPARPAAPVERDAKPRKKVVKKPVVRKLTEAEKRSDGDVLSRTRGKQLLVSISLSRQELTLYADGQEIARSRISSGTASHPTPTGIFSIIQKSRHHKSNLYSNAPMPYMQRLTWSGVALHQGVLPGYPASHGCIRLPEYFARIMWGASKLGMRVVVTRDAVTPSEFSHPMLFTAKSKEVATAPATAPVRVAEAGNSANDATALQTRPAIDANARAAQAQAPAVTQDGIPVIEPAEVVTDAPSAAPTPPAATAQPAPAATPAPAPAVAAAPMLDAKGKPLRAGPVSVFISRREGKLYVRKQFAPIFETAITIERPEQPLGTHLFTAVSAKGDTSFNWNVITMPGKPPADPKPSKREPNAPKTDLDLQPSDAAGALDRVKIPAEVAEKINELMSAGASVYVTDYGLGPETGLETDFIVWTRGR